MDSVTDQFTVPSEEGFRVMQPVLAAIWAAHEGEATPTESQVAAAVVARLQADYTL